MTLHLFEAFGIELEYMIVDRTSLDIRPIADRILRDETGTPCSEVAHEDVDWSNELVAHVIEFKTSRPVGAMAGWPSRFRAHVDFVQERLAEQDCCLLPTAMHPWMNPSREMELWPHDHSVIYEAFNRIFDCRGHGWANLQSVHLNLPFCGASLPDHEFGRLHAAIRLVLPLLPAIAASSPVVDGEVTGMMDNRLDVYRTNARRIESVTGRVIPERAFTRRDYDRMIFQPMYDDIAVHDPDGVLRDEFLNARGAIAPFGRGSIEIRVIDIQETPAADFAVLHACVDVLKALAAEEWCALEAQQAVEVEPLHDILLKTIRDADQAVIDDPDYLSLLGCADTNPRTALELWRELLDRCPTRMPAGRTVRVALEKILEQGPLARRIVTRLNGDHSRPAIEAVYRELAACLAERRTL